MVTCPIEKLGRRFVVWSAANDSAQARIPRKEEEFDILGAIVCPRLLGGNWAGRVCAWLGLSRRQET